MTAENLSSPKIVLHENEREKIIEKWRENFRKVINPQGLNERSPHVHQYEIYKNDGEGKYIIVR